MVAFAPARSQDRRAGGDGRPGLPLGASLPAQVISPMAAAVQAMVDVSQRLQILEPLQPVLRPTIIDPSVCHQPGRDDALATSTTTSPTISPTISLTLVRTPRERGVRQIDTDPPPEPPAAGRKTRRTRRSES